MTKQLKNDFITRFIIMVGTLMAWIPILLTIMTSVSGSIRDRAFRFDYLMPMELFPMALLGAGLLLWVALRNHIRRALIGGGLGVMVALFAGVQAFAEWTGLASGRTRLEGWVGGVAVAALVLYSLTLVLIGAGGVLLWRDLSRRRPSRDDNGGNSDDPEPGKIFWGGM